MNQSLPNPFISVIIRSYNRLSYVIELINRCLEQDYDNFEIVVIEQSDLNHWKKHKRELCSMDQKIRLIRAKPQGSAGARNLGVKNSSFNLIFFIDSDTMVLKNTFWTTRVQFKKLVQFYTKRLKVF